MNKEKIYNWLSHDVGIDLGTTNTLVYLRGQGVVLNEPSVVAVNQKTGQVVAVGGPAKAMLGRTPAHIQAVKPLVEGVISDFEIAEEMILYLLNKAGKSSRKFLGPRVVVGVPYGITNVETRAVKDATKNSGAREVYIVEEPMAAAVGIRLPVMEPVGNMIIDIGGGTADIAVISLGGIVRAKTLKVAGEKMNADIISYIRGEFKILIGEKTAEMIKVTIGSVVPPEEHQEMTIKGRDLVTGLPREVVITDSDVREAISQSIETIIDAVKEVLEITPPEIVSDIMQRGIHIVGGGAKFPGMKELLVENVKIPIHIAEDPLTAVAIGTGIILENMEVYKDALIQDEDELPPQK
ncbi:MAG: rod shape-determining protein [Candidatus Taylorbacteria bacterium RIFCSPLOWO2_12_FULL_43_20]|uniref:Cell shape-determining protein MreB n=1 Tax=Candidatus Taylorbacteria bacterium RIFCSPLOWO2_12_FULL_43_20 TaxID=1802332 RepID=A0A1G2P3L1_9BACT|nr:MAG: rod shape-determining protein [Candidatus Taylorbacteria bacterium RIFCSPHIGHO2_01_FULL_43_120]OHA23882.1 MAG: rod shape-determining protein [Candidatus Taylorbacteria bacterium RIFCSPHIGHO2_02_FULL_43_55]OHA28954.1 MAG: rod shape-determining protein [Candidatus Taylorbacteria bacterium RIFCSPHIGHO2_12_FULL_42_34]OHA31843.1 MAG: rod shape-determining protein [Candidatus Taylorbacteria bacterium RIFCSPLOWO2_01_FULL_43_83]OHA42212.1 MAG: rod shape-determining protein [Candidatus Taylorbac